jgi:hypothetical protein
LISSEIELLKLIFGGTVTLRRPWSRRSKFLDIPNKELSGNMQIAK